ncbi:MAG: trimethylamine methyltransferase family protein [Dehalococcoidales bacterium]|jgi:trimethylamine--corrinoid protein Co-methyltransferase|nr:trimethylamine methyltransferase family protein [Dehalococcoidales bacterium]
MRANYVQYNSPQFRLLSESQVKELHYAALQILEKTGVLYECQEAINLLAEAGADTSDFKRVKIPSHLVESAIRMAPKTITLYSREGNPAVVLNGQTGSHFGSMPDCPEYVDPYLKKRRVCYVEDIASTARVIDALPNIEWSYLATGHRTIPGEIADKVSLLQFILNSTKPVIAEINDAVSLREMIDLCTIVAGSEEELRRKPFFGGSSEPVTPLVQGKNAMEKSLICAEKGIPNVIYSMPLAGATTPATYPAVLALVIAEVLSQLVVVQLKNPGAPVIFGSMPNIMEMRTTIFPYGAPELSFLIASLTEVCHYYQLPMFGTAGCTDAEIVDAQAGAETTYQVLMSAMSGADLVHDVGLVYHATTISPELIVFVNEIIDMVRVSMNGLTINEETLPLELIDRIGPRGTYLSEQHTRNHFRKFWSPTIFDRSMTKDIDPKQCADLLNEKTIKIMETHQPKPLSEVVLKELQKVEVNWLKRVGLKEYPKKT